MTSIDSEAYFASYRPGQPRSEKTDLGDRLAIRPALLTDVVGLANVAFERHADSLELHRERFKKEIEAHPSWQDRLLFVGTVDGEVVAFGRANFFEPPEGALPNVVPAGWYLGGTIVSPAYRRLGIGLELTRLRLTWIAERTTIAYYCVNALNRASIDLHARFQFEEVSRDISFPGSNFTGGVGILFRATLTQR